MQVCQADLDHQLAELRELPTLVLPVEAQRLRGFEQRPPALRDRHQPGHRYVQHQHEQLRPDRRHSH